MIGGRGVKRKRVTKFKRFREYIKEIWKRLYRKVGMDWKRKG